MDEGKGSQNLDVGTERKNGNIDSDFRFFGEVQRMFAGLALSDRQYLFLMAFVAHSEIPAETLWT